MISPITYIIPLVNDILVETGASFGSLPLFVFIYFSLAHKVDLSPTTQRIISTEEGQQFANEHGFDYFEVSSKDNINVDESLLHILTATANLKIGTPTEGKPEDQHVDVDCEDKSSCKDDSNDKAKCIVM